MKREVNKMLMEPFNFTFDDWEVDSVWKSLPFSQNVKIFEIGNGDPSLSFALSLKYHKFLKGMLYIDPVSESEVGGKVFIRKKLAFSTIYANGCLKTESLETDVLEKNMSNRIKKYYTGNELPSITILNFCKNKFYTMHILNKYSDFINGGVILFNNLHDNDDWSDIFRDFTKDKKFIVFKDTKGIGLVLGNQSNDENLKIK
jgi:hypothetical protein